MQIVDNQDMTISIWVFPEVDISDVSLELIAAIKQGNLTVKAAGVWGGEVLKYRRWKRHRKETVFSVLTWTTTISPDLMTAHGRNYSNANQ